MLHFCITIVSHRLTRSKSYKSLTTYSNTFNPEVRIIQSFCYYRPPTKLACVCPQGAWSQVPSGVEVSLVPGPFRGLGISRRVGMSLEGKGYGSYQVPFAGGVGMSMWVPTPSSGHGTWDTHPDAQWQSPSRWYASYWNAFLLNGILPMNSMLKQDSIPVGCQPPTY